MLHQYLELAYTHVLYRCLLGTLCSHYSPCYAVLCHATLAYMIAWHVHIHVIIYAQYIILLLTRATECITYYCVCVSLTYSFH
jgi:hypothetical protein